MIDGVFCGLTYKSGLDIRTGTLFVVVAPLFLVDSDCLLKLMLNNQVFPAF